MAGPFFGKRDSDHTPATTPRAPGAAPGATPAPAPAPFVPAPAPMPAPAAPGSAPAPASDAGAAKLTVGANIKLRGVEITDCDTLVIEGMVEANMNSRLVQISERGEFKGNAEVDIAEVRGVFDGTLTARQKLMIYSTGRVTGKIRYGKIVIEEGGQLSGEVSCGAPQAAAKK